jgi:hypothetical protein
MLPLKSFVNLLQNTLRYPDCLVRASPFSNRRLEHEDAGFAQEKSSDRFHIELPEFRYVGRRVVALGWSRCFHRMARFDQCGGHRYPFPLSRCPSGRGSWSLAFEAGRRVRPRAFLSLSCGGLGGRYCKRSDCRSLCAMYPAARLSPCQLRINSIISQPRSVRGILIPGCKRRYRRAPWRKASAAPNSTSLSARSGLPWATNAPSCRRTGIPSGCARLIGGAVSYSGRRAGGEFIRHPQSASRPRLLPVGLQPWR